MLGINFRCMSSELESQSNQVSHKCFPSLDSDMSDTINLLQYNLIDHLKQVSPTMHSRLMKPKSQGRIPRMPSCLHIVNNRNLIMHCLKLFNTLFCTSLKATLQNKLIQKLAMVIFSYSPAFQYILNYQILTYDTCAPQITISKIRTALLYNVHFWFIDLNLSKTKKNIILLPYLDEKLRH